MFKKVLTTEKKINVVNIQFVLIPFIGKLQTVSVNNFTRIQLLCPPDISDIESTQNTLIPLLISIKKAFPRLGLEV